MKRLLLFVLASVMLLSLLTSCNTPQESGSETKSEFDPDNIAEYPESIWDGSVSGEFHGGDGTKEKPFEIANAEQLALLAQSVNEGHTYTAQYFSLLCDVDLNSLEWTPIGTGIHAFEGHFDGNGHTVKNLMISDGAHYNYEYPTGRLAPYCDMGLFATVQDGSVQSLVIDGATIVISQTASLEDCRVGVVCGTVRAIEGAAVLSDIVVKNAEITSDFAIKERPMYLSAGGVVGHVYSYNDASITVSLVSADTSVSLADAYASNNKIGILLGSVNILNSTFSMENCVAYQSLAVSPEQYYYTFTNDYCGAIGSAQASAKPFTVKNVFSKLILHKPALDVSIDFPPAIVANVTIGDAYYYTQEITDADVGYRFENVFGAVVLVDGDKEETQTLTTLYQLPAGPDFVQINCQGGESLPENHGFDPEIWNVDDLSKPLLK